MKKPSDKPKSVESCEGVVQFPRHIRRKGENGEVVAWLSNTTREISAARYAELQNAYGGALSIEHRDHKPLLRRELFLRSGEHARQEASTLAKRVYQYLGVRVILQAS